MTAAVVHVVDDDDSMRTALTRLLRAKGYETRGYRSAGEFLMAERPDVPGCVLLDVSMPGPSGLDLHDALTRNGDSIPVIFLTGRGDIAMSVHAMKTGAVDFLTKPVKREALMAAIESALSRDEEQRATDGRRRALRERYETLTAREREVFARVSDGKLNKQIAAELGTSERTVKAHRAQVMSKLQVESVAELVRVADRLYKQMN
jgi:RNA polymerase sigma factor (sigma-70 family)